MFLRREPFVSYINRNVFILKVKRKAVISGYFSVSLFPLPTTIFERAKSAMTFGMTISWLNISCRAQTRLLFMTVPRKMKAMARVE